MIESTFCVAPWYRITISPSDQCLSYAWNQVIIAVRAYKLLLDITDIPIRSMSGQSRESISPCHDAYLCNSFRYGVSALPSVPFEVAPAALVSSVTPTSDDEALVFSDLAFFLFALLPSLVIVGFVDWVVDIMAQVKGVDCAAR